MSKPISKYGRLRRRLKELNKEEDRLNADIKSLNDRKSIVDKTRTRLLAEMAEMKKEHPVVVTDHAVLRYLERIAGVDVDRARRLVLPDGDRVIEAIKKLGGTGTFPVGTSHRLVAEKGRIVTVLEP